LLHVGPWIAVAAASLLGPSTAAPGSTSAGNYPGSAKSLAPTARAVLYVRISTSRALLPADAAASLRPGFKSGWNVNYERTAPYTSLAGTIIVYANQAHARAAYRTASAAVCGRSCRTDAAAGAPIRYRLVTGTGVGVGVLNAFTTCRNVYVAVGASGYSSQANRLLPRDSKALIAAIYAKAVSLGMSACSR
jgi:hypothetical protein